MNGFTFDQNADSSWAGICTNINPSDVSDIIDEYAAAETAQFEVKLAGRIFRFSVGEAVRIIGQRIDSV